MTLDDAEPLDFADFAQLSRVSLWRTAWALTGDAQSAEDLVQTALMKLWPKWRRVSAAGDPTAYVRRILYTTYVSWWRRKPSSEVPVAEVRDQVDVVGGESLVALRHDLTSALAALPRHQRAVVVCRYLDDLSEAQTADLLGCSVGTVKSQSARALARLGAILTPAYPIETRSE